MSNLLFSVGDFKTIVLIAGGVLLALAVIYGLIRKFSRMSWLGWQIALLFCATIPLGMIPESSSNGTLIFCTVAGGLVALIAFVFLVGSLLRAPFLALEQGKTGGKVFNRLLGAITSVFNIFIFVAVFGGLGLVVAQPFAQEAFSAVYTNPVWTNFFAAHALDLFLVFVLASVLRAGYRSGFLRMIVTLVVLALTLAAVFLAMYMTLQVPFLVQFAAKIASTLKMNSIAAGWIGFGIVSLITAVVLMIAVVLVAIILNLLLKLFKKSKVFRALDGLLFSLITCVITVGFIMGVNFAVSYLMNGSLVHVAENLTEIAQNMPETFRAIVAAIANGVRTFAEATTNISVSLEQAITSSPLAKIFYRYNPLNLLFPAQG